MSRFSLLLVTIAVLAVGISFFYWEGNKTITSAIITFSAFVMATWFFRDEWFPNPPVWMIGPAKVNGWFLPAMMGISLVILFSDVAAGMPLGLVFSLIFGGALGVIQRYWIYARFQP